MANHMVVYIFTIITLTSVAVSGQGTCSFPTAWQNLYYSGYTNTKSAILIIVNSTVWADLSSGSTSSCNHYNETSGVISFTQLNRNIKAEYCQEAVFANTAILFRKTQDVTNDNALTLDQCTETLGARTSFKAFIRYPFTTADWAKNPPIVPAATYKMSTAIKEDKEKVCKDTEGQLVIGGGEWTATSKCIKGDQSYINPLAGKLLEVAGLADSVLSVADASAESGMLVLAVPTTAADKLSADITYKFLLVRFNVMSKPDGTSYLKMFFVADSPADPTGYVTVDKIPLKAKNSLIEIGITSDECKTSNCQNGGTCIQKWKQYACSCVPGYDGQQCEIDIDECASTPCKNGGTCKNNVNSFECTCPQAFDGPMCQFENLCVQSDPCKNGATCLTVEDGTNSKVFCMCAKGFFGQHCEFVDVCEATAECENGGTCFQVGQTDYFCLCPAPFSGKKCEINNGTTCASMKCQNGGVCQTNDVGAYCECSIFFEGDMCNALSDWFVVALVLLILLVIIIVILLIVCCCFCCCGWRPNSTANYEAMNNSESSLNKAQPSMPGTIEFNLSPASPYYGIQMLGSSK